MDIRAVAFDANGTLVKILTEDGNQEIFRAAAHFLTYQGIDLCRDQVRDLYFRIMAEQQHASRQQHPEFDAVGIWRRIFGAREAGLTTVMFDSDQGKKSYLDCVPDYTITDLRDLLAILGM
jgi:FMN phosphatase YigB (HAD superfamily)